MVLNYCIGISVNRILFLVGSFYPAQCGGPNNSLYWIAKSLVKSGVDVSVYTTSKGQSDNQILNEKVNLDGIKSYYFSYILSHLFCIRMILRLIYKVRTFDIVHLTSIFYPLSFICALICIFFRVKFSVSPRGELDKAALKYSSTLKKFYIKTTIWAYKRCDFALATSEVEESDIKRFLGPSVRVKRLPNYIETKPLVKNITEKKEGYILCIGRIHPKKNIESLIKAYISLPQVVQNNLPLVIAGKGENKYLEDLRKLSMSAAGEVSFVGHIEGTEKEHLLFHSMIMILPSHGENFGNVVTEALAQGTPVIASEFTPWKLLVDNKCGYLVSNNPDSLRTSILNFIEQSKESRIVMQNNAINLIRNNFDINTHSENVLEVFT